MYLWGYSQLGCKPIDMIFGSENERFTLPRQAGGTGYSPTALNLSKDWLQGRSVAHPGVLGGRGGIQTWECLAPRLKVLKTPSQNSRLESGKNPSCCWLNRNFKGRTQSCLHHSLWFLLDMCVFWLSVHIGVPEGPQEFSWLFLI